MRALYCICFFLAVPLIGEEAALTEKYCESLGYHLAETYSARGFSDEQAFKRGIERYFKGEKLPSWEKEDLDALTKERFLQRAGEKREEADGVLTELKKNPQWTERSQGKLFYRILHKGEGEEQLNLSSAILLHIHVRTIEGRTLINSYEEKGPFSATLDNIVPGIAIGLEGAKKGEKRELYIHPDLGYKLTSHMLPPNSLLIVEVEVVDILISSLR